MLQRLLGPALWGLLFLPVGEVGQRPQVRSLVFPARLAVRGRSKNFQNTFDFDERDQQVLVSRSCSSPRGAVPLDEASAGVPIEVLLSHTEAPDGACQVPGQPVDLG